MGGSPLAPAAVHPMHQPGLYRGAAGLSTQQGTYVFAGYGLADTLQLSSLDPPLHALRSNSGSESQLYARQLSNGSDATTAGSPLSSGFAGRADHAAPHSRTSSGWTGFDGPCYAFGGGVGTAGAGIAAPVTDATATLISLHGVAAIEQQRRHLASLHDNIQNDALHLQLQRTSLAHSESDVQPHVCTSPHHVTKSTFSVNSTQTFQHSGLAGGRLESCFRTEDEALPRDLIGNLDLYL